MTSGYKTWPGNRTPAGDDEIVVTDLKGVDVKRIDDKTTNVICYVAEYRGGISCVKK